MLQVHELAELFHSAAAYRHLKIQILQPQYIGVVKPGFDFADLVQVDAERAVAAEEVGGREFIAEFGDVHRHDVGFTPRIDKCHFFMRFGIVNIVDRRDDDPFVLHQINCVVSRATGLALAGKDCCCHAASSLCSMLIIRDSWYGFRI